MTLFVPVMFVCSVLQYGSCQPYNGQAFATEELCMSDLEAVVDQVSSESENVYVAGGNCIEVVLQRGA